MNWRCFAFNRNRNTAQNTSDLASKSTSQNLSSGSNENSDLHNEPKEDLQPIYIHPSTPESPALLAALPTEIIDTIVSDLQQNDIRSLRASSIIFKPSTQSHIFRTLDIYDFRSSSPNGNPSTLSLFYNLLDHQPHLVTYIVNVTFRSLMDPLRQEDIGIHLPRLLALLTHVKRMTLQFNCVRYLSNKTQRNIMGVMRESLENYFANPSQHHPLELHVECDFPAPIVLAALDSLPISKVNIVRNEELISRLDAMGWEWINALSKYPALQIFSDNAVEQDDSCLEYLCQKLLHVTALHITPARRTHPADIVAALEPARERLKSLSLSWSHLEDINPTSNDEAMNLSSFHTLRTLDIDAKFLITATAALSTTLSQPTAYKRYLHPALKNPFFDIHPTSRISTNLPPNLDTLTIRHTAPFSRMCQKMTSLNSTLPLHTRRAYLNGVVEWLIFHFSFSSSCLSTTQEQTQEHPDSTFPASSRCMRINFIGQPYNNNNIPTDGDDAEDENSTLREFVFPEGMRRELRGRGLDVEIWTVVDEGQWDGEGHGSGNGMDTFYMMEGTDEFGRTIWDLAEEG